MNKQVCLGVTPVGISTPSGVVKAMMFTDNGSDTTLITKRFTVNHNIKTRLSSLTISTVNETKATSSDQANVTLVLLDNGERVEVMEAFEIADLPMRAVESIGGISNALATPARLGPDWTTSLIDVLNRFRLGIVAVAADIQETFFQMPEDQRDALRLLW
ncbi:unnamed protein product [Echinostoma caproni]|uniref:Peptidase A2 domain-containing protein n=1 Tax=Echinostoma caproni TaxID=27848 RepID=A0A183ATS0_9TREM|nr:unnamed protein product [Echinostoma caproni]